MPVRGERVNQCPTCNLFFSSVTAFDKHRFGKHGRNRRCLTPEEMQAKGMHLNIYGCWASSKMDEASKNKIIGAKNG